MSSVSKEVYIRSASMEQSYICNRGQPLPTPGKPLFDKLPNCSLHVAVAPVDSDIFAVEVRDEGLHGQSRILTNKVKNVLDKENFRSRDFWEGYKLYCLAHYSHCRRSRTRFVASKMGRVVSLIHSYENVRWGSLYDGRVRQVWAMMEEYAQFCRGQDWTNLRSLMERFDDVKKLSASENGSLLLQVIEDDENGTERLFMESQVVQLNCTDIFEELRGRLKTVGSNLNSLMESSGTALQGCKNVSGKRRKVGPT